MSTNTQNFFENLDTNQEELNCHPGEYNENYIEPNLGPVQYFHCPYGWYDMPGVERGPYSEDIFPWFENTIKNIVFASYIGVGKNYRKDSRRDIGPDFSSFHFDNKQLIEDFFDTNNFDYYLNYLKIILPTFELVSLGIIYSFKYINKISISEFETTFILQTLEETIKKYNELSKSRTIKQHQKNIGEEFASEWEERLIDSNISRKWLFNPLEINENAFDFVTWTNILDISVNDLENDYKKYLQQYIDLRNQKMKFLSSLPMPKFFIKECADRKWGVDANNLKKLGEFKTCIKCLWRIIPFEERRMSFELPRMTNPKNYTICDRCSPRKEVTKKSPEK